MRTLNSIYFYIFTFTLVFGVVFYDMIGILTRFTYTDELTAFLLLILFVAATILKSKEYKSKSLLTFVFISIFYLYYSLYIVKSNVKQAIWMDFAIQAKPYIAFFTTLYLRPDFNTSKRLIISKLCIVLWLIILLISLTNNVYNFFGHPSRYATAVTIISLLYFYVSKKTTRNTLITFSLLFIGVLSGRSKFYAFYVIAIFIFITKPKNIRKPSIKNIILTTIIIILIIVITWHKINYYFILNNGPEDSHARRALYATSVEIFKDYLPFGSGLGSFATYASAEYYSPIYKKYNLDTIYGLSPEFRSFITDTFFPELAQFGIIGLILFLTFWIKQIKKITRIHKETEVDYLFRIGILIIIFFLIESTTDSTFTHNRGMFMLMILGHSISEGEKMSIKSI